MNRLSCSGCIYYRLNSSEQRYEHAGGYDIEPDELAVLQAASSDEPFATAARNRPTGVLCKGVFKDDRGARVVPITTRSDIVGMWVVPHRHETSAPEAKKASAAAQYVAARLSIDDGEEHRLATGSALVVSAASAEDLAPLTERATAAGLRDLLLHVDSGSAARQLEQHTIIRRAALRQNYQPLGYPVISRLGEDARDAAIDALVGVCKYASVILLPAFDQAAYYPLLTLRQSIYTDPQKPIQVEPGVYPIGSPGPDSPVFLTTNFSLTYFLVSGEIENSGTSAHLVVHDCEGMSVLTAWAAGKFTGAKVAEFIRASDLPGKESGRTLVIPGQAAVISGDLAEGLPGFKVLVGPPEAADIPTYVKHLLQ